MNESYQMKPFETNIICFSGLNWCQLFFFFNQWNKGLRKNYTKIKLKKYQDTKII